MCINISLYNNISNLIINLLFPQLQYTVIFSLQVKFGNEKMHFRLLWISFPCCVKISLRWTQLKLFGHIFSFVIYIWEYVGRSLHRHKNMLNIFIDNRNCHVAVAAVSSHVNMIFEAITIAIYCKRIMSVGLSKRQVSIITYKLFLFELCRFLACVIIRVVD